MRRLLLKALKRIHTGVIKMEKAGLTTGLNDKGLVWIDLELTGLDLEKDKIMEIACLVTDEELNPLSEGIDIVVHQPNEVLDAMNDWCQKHHGKSGLTQACRESPVTVEEAEQKVLSLLEKHVAPGVCPLAGNTVHMDRRFLHKEMPRLDAHLHYRIVDVSTIKELCRRWYPADHREALRRKTGSHRALADIKESIDELKFYRSRIFK